MNRGMDNWNKLKVSHEYEGVEVNKLKYLVDNHKESIIKGSLAAGQFCWDHENEKLAWRHYPYGRYEFNSCPWGRSD